MTRRSLACAALALTLSACTTTAASDTAMKSAPVAKAPPAASQTSASSFAATEARLRDAIAARDFRLFTVVDHGAGARSVGQDIGESKLFIFGNPKGGTPLMQADPLMGLELPLKVLIYTDAAGQTQIAAANTHAAANRRGVTRQHERLKKIDGALAAIVAEAGG